MSASTDIETTWTPQDLGYKTECWVWSRNVHINTGYGQAFSPRHNNTRAAHVVVWETMRGPIPQGLCLDHKCRNRICVNPDHCEVVSHGENVRRGERAHLTWEQVHEIRSIPAGTHTQRELAALYNVGQVTIHDVLNFKTWIPDEFTPVIA